MGIAIAAHDNLGEIKGFVPFEEIDDPIERAEANETAQPLILSLAQERLYRHGHVIVLLSTGYLTAVSYGMGFGRTEEEESI